MELGMCVSGWLWRAYLWMAGAEAGSLRSDATQPNLTSTSMTEGGAKFWKHVSGAYQCTLSVSLLNFEFLSAGRPMPEYGHS